MRIIACIAQMVCTLVLHSCLMLNDHRKLQECLYEHGGGEVGEIWFDGDVPVFHVKFHTKLALRKLLAGQSEVEKKLMTKLQSRFQPFLIYGHLLPKHKGYSDDNYCSFLSVE